MTLGALALGFLALSTPASAQDTGSGFNAHGFSQVPQDGDPRDFLGVERAGRFFQGNWWVTGLVEYADQPLMMSINSPATDEAPGTTTDAVPALDDLLALNVSAGFAPLSSVRIHVQAPIYFSAKYLNASDFTDLTPQTGSSVGDIRLGGMISIAKPKVGGGGFGLALVPEVALPTGSSDRYLGRPGVGANFKVATTVEGSKFTLGADVGIGYQPSRSLGNVAGGAQLLGGVGLGVLVKPNMALLGEFRTAPYLSGAKTIQGVETAFSAFPGEAGLAFRGQLDSGLHFALGGAKGVLPGVGSANYRIFAQIGFGHVIASKDDRDLDGVMDWDDACPSDRETINNYKDSDGCPDEGGRILVKAIKNDVEEEYVSITVRDSNGEVVAQFETSLPDAATAEIPAGAVTVKANFPGFQASEELIVEAGDYPIELQLTPVTPARLKINAVTVNGQPVPGAGLSVVGDGAPSQGIKLDDAGSVSFDIPPGDFLIFIKANDLGIWRTDVKLAPGEAREVRAVLGAARARVLSDRISLSESVYFDTGKSTIKAESLPLLDEVASLLIATPDILEMEIQGHTDSDGDDASNMALSQERAVAVMNYLRSQGVATGRLTAQGYGESAPISSNDTADGRSLNRRVEFIITKRMTR